MIRDLEEEELNHKGHEEHEERKRRRSSNHSLQAILENADIEVDEKAEPEAHGFQIGEELRFMDEAQSLYSLRLDDHTAPHQEIKPLAGDLDVLVRDEHLLLVLDLQSRLEELVLECPSVDPFDEPRPQDPMHLDRRSNHPMRDLFIGFRYRLIPYLTHDAVPFV
jgi:hypothetical protein